MDRALEEAIRLLERAAKLGWTVKFEDGLNVILRKTTSEAASVTEDQLLEELTKRLPAVRQILQRRAVAALANKHIGLPIFSKDYGTGALISASEDGVAVSIGQEMRRLNEEEVRRSQTTIRAEADSFFLILEAEPDAASSADPAQLEPKKKRLFGVI